MLLGLGTGGVASVVIAVITSFKTFWKILGWALFLFIGFICLLVIQGGAMFSSVGSAASVGQGGDVTTSPLAIQGPLSLNNTIGDVQKSVGGNLIDTLNYRVDFTYNFDATTKPPLNYPNAGIYYFLIDPLTITRADYDLSVNNNVAPAAQSVFLIDDQIPVTPDNQTYAKTYAVKLHFNSDAAQQKTSAFTKDKPFCTAAVFVKDRSKVDTITANPTQASFESDNSNVAAIAMECVDAQGKSTQGTGVFACPLPGKSLICTQGSGINAATGATIPLFSHSGYQAIDIGIGAGTPVLAPVDGTFLKIFDNPGCGPTIQYLGKDNRRYDFHHAMNATFAPGAAVKVGTKIGEVWNGVGSVYSCWTGAHLHTEIFGDGSASGALSSQNSKRAFPEDLFQNLLGCNVNQFPDANECKMNIDYFKTNGKKVNNGITPTP